MSYDGAPILGPLSLHISGGETVALVGPSGIGKTTLLRIMAGLETGFDGTLHAASPVGLIFQEPTLLPWRTVCENLHVTTRITKDEAEGWLSQVGLAGRGADFPGQLSLGQQRRLSIARAFAVRPALLLMDEPFVSLDPELVEDMMHLFAQLRDAHHVATVLVTHVEAEAERLADRILALGGSPATLTAERQNKGAYFQSSASGVTSSRS
ncbi:ABC transporter ATP-binding protein [Litoreibacter roseus]|uniref:ABC transporter ATP-binding protein n=2 Tax=Litoreibacter roseus TaxID=2601869 RepID=A0A6N6JG00_9RHOB|nr:ABC transporter ATP-binding protein [Litoreibacter roseus]